MKAGRSRRLWPGMLAPLALLALAAAPRHRGRVGAVVDGNTVRLTSGERIRIAGIDAPEVHADQARCGAEMVLGEAAAARARALLDHGDVTFVRVGRSYGRTVANVALDGRDLADQLTELGVARRWPRGTTKPDWCAAGGNR